MAPRSSLLNNTWHLGLKEFHSLLGDMTMLFLIVFMGLFPKPFLDRIEPSVNKLVHHVEVNSDHREPAVATKGDRVVPESERRAEGEAAEGGHGSEEGE